MADIATWWAEFAASLGRADVPLPAAQRLERTAELCERLLGLVLSGQKTCVFSDPADCADGRLPTTGDLQVLADFAGAPRALVRMDESTVLPSMRSPPPMCIASRRPHATASRGAGSTAATGRPAPTARGVAFRDDLAVVFQRFTCLYSLRWTAPWPPLRSGRGVRRFHRGRRG